MKGVAPARRYIYSFTSLLGEGASESAQRLSEKGVIQPSSSAKLGFPFMLVASEVTLSKKSEFYAVVARDELAYAS